MPYIIASLLLGGLLAASAAPQPRQGLAAPAGRNPAAGDAADYALVLRDPFSPVGYRPPVAEWQAPADAGPAVSNVPPVSIDLKAKAKALLRVKGIVKQGDAYVANINGAIVRAGDEVGVTVDGQTVAFVIRAISMKLVQIEPRE